MRACGPGDKELDDKSVGRHLLLVRIELACFVLCIRSSDDLASYAMLGLVAGFPGRWRLLA